MTTFVFTGYLKNARELGYKKPLILDIIFGSFTKMFDSQQAKQYLVSSINNIVHKLLNKLPNN